MTVPSRASDTLIARPTMACFCAPQESVVSSVVRRRDPRASASRQLSTRPKLPLPSLRPPNHPPRLVALPRLLLLNPLEMPLLPPLSMPHADLCPQPLPLPNRELPRTCPVLLHYPLLPGDPPLYLRPTRLPRLRLRAILPRPLHLLPPA